MRTAHIPKWRAYGGRVAMKVAHIHIFAIIDQPFQGSHQPFLLSFSQGQNILPANMNSLDICNRSVFWALASLSSIVHSLACSSNQKGQIEGSPGHSCSPHRGGCPHNQSWSHSHLHSLCTGWRWNSRSPLYYIPEHLHSHMVLNPC